MAGLGVPEVFYSAAVDEALRAYNDRWGFAQCIPQPSKTRQQLGVPIAPRPYRCPSCGVFADAYGRHAAFCYMSGAACRGHTVFKLVLAFLYRLAGCNVQLEQGALDSAKRPADILVKVFMPRPLAIDTTIWSRHVYP